jgi:hypothetical protein
MRLRGQKCANMLASLRRLWLRGFGIFFGGCTISVVAGRFRVMEATHFCEVWKYHFDGHTACSRWQKIEYLQENLEMTDFNFVCDTIAVWRIKKADSPLQDRLRQRGLLRTHIHSMWMQRIEYLQNQAKENADTKL